MDEVLTITAVSGWALPRQWFADEVACAFPRSRIKVIYPETPEKFEEAEILLRQHPADLYIGYSLGSLWLLKHKDLLPRSSIKALLAPILSFLAQDGMGGTTSEIQLKYLSRILRQHSDKRIALKKIFAYSDFPFPEKIINDVPDREILLRGLEFLKTCKARGEDAKIFLSILGKDDTFIDSALLARHIPDLDIVQGVGHAPGNLLKHLAERLGKPVTRAEE